MLSIFQSNTNCLDAFEFKASRLLEKKMLFRFVFKVKLYDPSLPEDSKVSLLIDPNTRQWNSNLVRSLFHPLIASKILDIPLSMQPRRDKLLWHFNSNGIYSVKSGYKIAKQKKAEEDGSLSGSCSSGSDRTWKLLWKVKVRPRVKFFVWKILQNALPTAKNLFIRRVGDGICGVCGEADETIYHCLFECHIPKALWKESPMGKPWSRLPGTSMSDFFHLLFTSGDEFTMAHVTNILWQIWKARCAWLFDNKAVSITSSLYQAEAETKDYISAVNKEDDCQKPIPQIATWKPPCASHVKFNVDAALKDGCMAIGGLVRDHNGATLQSFSMKLFSNQQELVLPFLLCPEGLESGTRMS
jgi:hypothetical protein